MRGKAVLLDANLLVLLVVGSASSDYIGKHKRLQVYTDADFELLNGILAGAERIVVTPNTLTEASNLARQIHEPARSDIGRMLKIFIEKADEVFIESAKAAGHPAYQRLGITDAALLDPVFEDHVLLTSDLDLYLEASRLGRPAENFNHHIEANR